MIKDVLKESSIMMRDWWSLLYSAKNT